MSEQQTGQPWWTGLPDDVEPATDTQLANVVRNGTVPGRGSRVLLPWPLMLRVLRRVAVRDDVLAETEWMRDHWERCFNEANDSAADALRGMRAAEAEVVRLREWLAATRKALTESIRFQGAFAARVAKVEAQVGEWDAELKSGAIRDSGARHCWSLAVREIRAALASVPTVDAGDREPASEVRCCEPVHAEDCPANALPASEVEPCDHLWSVEYLPDPMSAGSVVPRWGTCLHQVRRERGAAVSAANIITDALAAHWMGDWLEVAPDRYRRRCTCGEFLDARGNAFSFREHQAAVVMATFGDMSPLHQAEVLGRGLEKFHDRNDGYWERVVGPWIKVQP